jgi:geranylgeranyl diphosphate synthase type II
VHALKTGRLIGASVECVLLLNGMTPAVTRAFRSFADELGVLFQIVDDILDVTSTADDMGKPQGSDERQGKRTYVSEYGLQGAQRLAAECHARAHAALAQTGRDGNGQLTELEQITDFIFTRTS